MGQDVNNPHDQFFRATFSRLDVARDFLKNYLPAEIVAKFDLPTLEVAQESFSDDELKSHHTDFLFRINLKSGDKAFIFILLEHKSYPDELAAFQLLRYMVQIWEKLLHEKTKKLPPIFPIVFYHGKKKWKISHRFSDLINASEDFADYIPRFSYHLCDLSAFTSEDLKGEALIRAAMLAMKNVFGKTLHEQCLEIAEFAKLSFEKETLEFVALIIRYFMAVQKHLTTEDVKEAIQTAFPEKTEEVMNQAVREFFNQGVQHGIQQGVEIGKREGLQQGMEQGLEIGRKDSLLEISLKILHKKFGKIDNVSETKIKKLASNQLEELGLAIFDFIELKDLKNWLKANGK